MADSYFEREDRIRTAGLTMPQTFYLCTINRFMGKNDSAWPSHAAIAEAMNSTVRSVIRYQNELEELGVLEVVTGKGCKTSNEYRILFEKLPSKGDNLSPFGLVGMVPDCHTNSDSVSPFAAKEDPGIVTNCHSNSDRLSPRIVTNCHTEQLNRNSHEQHTGNFPVSSEPPREKSGKSELNLEKFVKAWNDWHSQGLVRTSVRDFERIGKSLRVAWNRGWNDPEQRERLLDLEALKASIAESREFLKGSAWFDAAGLVGGKNGNRIWYARQLLAGVYRDKGGTTATADSGSRFPPFSEALKVIRNIDVQRPYREILITALGDRPTEALRKIGIARIQEANDFQRREFEAEYRRELAPCQ